MKTKAELRHSFKVYTDEVERCKAGQCYWALVHLALSLPDIFNTLEIDDKEPKTAQRYRGWCREYLTRHDPAIHEDEWWDIRNNILHQGYTLTKKTNRIKGFVFCPPGVNKHKQIDPVTNKMRLDVCLLADEMLAAMDRWIDDLVANPARQQQVEKYLPELVWEAPGPFPQENRTSVASSSMTVAPIGAIPFSITGEPGVRLSTSSQGPQ